MFPQLRGCDVQKIRKGMERCARIGVFGPEVAANANAPETEAEAVGELTRVLGELEQANRDTAADLRELGLLTRKDVI